MGTKALFEGLVTDEYGRGVEVVPIGDEMFYMIDDDGFHRHIESEHVDRQVLHQLFDLIEGHESLISEGAMKMLGQDDIFTKAVIENQLKNLDAQIDAVLTQGLPEELRAWLGMLGFHVIIDIHGEVVHVEQPGAVEGPDE